MKFLTRLNIFAKKASKKLMPVSDIEKLAYNTKIDILGWK